MRPLECTQPDPMQKVTIDKIIPNAQTPRVEKIKSNPNNRERIRNYIASKTMTHIPTCNSYLRRSTRTTERAQTIYDEETNTYLKYRQLMQHPKYKEVWSKSSADKFGRLANGLADGRIEKPTKTICFIRKGNVPVDRRKDVTYGSFSCDYKPNKKEQNRTRLMMGGDRINYPDDCGTPTADMIIFKILTNSIISTPNAKCLMMDIKDFYLNTPMKRLEYMRLKLTDIPDEVIEPLQFTRVSNSRRLRLLRSFKGNVRLTTSGDYCPRVVGNETRRARLLPKKDCKWTVETQNQTNLFLPHGR